MTVIPEPPALPAGFTEHALNVMVQVRELGRTVDGFGFAPEGRRVSIGTVATLPEDFLQHAAAGMDVNPDLAAAFGITATEVREALNFKREYIAAANEIRLVAKGMEDTVAERMAHVGERALRFYKAVQRANRRQDTTTAVPHLAAMARALSKGRKKKKPITPVPPVDSTPADPPKKGDAK